MSVFYSHLTQEMHRNACLHIAKSCQLGKKVPFKMVVLFFCIKRASFSSLPSTAVGSCRNHMQMICSWSPLPFLETVQFMLLQGLFCELFFFAKCYSRSDSCCNSNSLIQMFQKSFKRLPVMEIWQLFATILKVTLPKTPP